MCEFSESIMTKGVKFCLDSRPSRALLTVIPNVNTYDVCLNFDYTGYSVSDSGVKKRAEVGVGGRRFGLHPDQYQEKLFSPTLHCVAVLVISF